MCIADPPLLYSVRHRLPFSFPLSPVTAVLFEDSPRFQIRLDPKRSEFPANARMFESAERRLLIVQQAVDRYPPGLDLRCDVACATKVRTAHVSVEAVLRIVGDSDRILFVFVRDD